MNVSIKCLPLLSTDFPAGNRFTVMISWNFLLTSYSTKRSQRVLLDSSKKRTITPLKTLLQNDYSAENYVFESNHRPLYKVLAKRPNDFVGQASGFSELNEIALSMN